MGAHTSYLLQLAGIVPLGVGMGLAMTPATSGITGALPAAQQGIGSALNDLSRELGGALGIAVIGSVLTATYRGYLHLPAHQRRSSARPARRSPSPPRSEGRRPPKRTRRSSPDCTSP
jgi:hypothetical protein